jgi:UDP-N-acetylmuramate--alanine ligase
MSRLPKQNLDARRVAEVSVVLERRSGHVHLAGIGGIGMAGVAIHLAARGFRVTGCDLAAGRVSDWLQERGIPVAIGHSPKHLDADVDCVIRSTAVPEDSPEIAAAAARGIPVFARGSVLPALLHGRTSVAVSGTHGKTTTSAMIATILHDAGMNPGFCIGGEILQLGGVAGAGADRVMVVEADESDGTVALYEPNIAVITNIEYDHMEHFDSEEALVECFQRFAAQARWGVVYCADDPRASVVCGALPKGISYGFAEGANLRGVNIELTNHGVACDVMRGANTLGRITLGIAGRHNLLNALGAAAASMELGLRFDQVAAGLATFRHARRRFEEVYNDGTTLVVSDYAHHPTEIRALVRTALPLKRNRVVAIFQPHRYTRTRALGPDFPPAFEGLDEVVLVPVYEASEEPIEGGTSKDLLNLFAERGLVRVRYEPSLKDAWKYLRGVLHRGDIFLVVGAGDVEQVAFWARDEFSGGGAGRG